MFVFLFSFSSKTLISLLISYFIHELLRNVLLSFQIFQDFPAIFLLLIYNLILLWTENIFCTIWFLLNLSSLFLWPKIWSIFDSLPCHLRKKCILLLFVWLLATLWTTVHQAPLSVGFSRQEYWSGLPGPPPGDPPDPGIEPTSSALAGRFFTTSAIWARR